MRTNLFKKVLRLIQYKILQQYIWKFLLNSNDNKFFNHGRLINCSIQVKRSRNYIEICKDV